jgi:hypothetical protein
MSEFELFLAKVLEPVEDSCGGRGCHVEKDGAWNVRVLTDHNPVAELATADVE